MMTRNDILFSVVFRHTFFPDGLNPFMTATPTTSTAQWMRTHGMVYRTGPARLTVLAETEQEGALSETIPTEFELLFFLRISMKSLLYLTQPMAGQPSQHKRLYSNVLLADQVLTAQPITSATDSLATASADSLQDALGETYQLNASGSGEQSALDIRRLPEGVYKNGENTVFITPDKFTEPYFGLLQVVSKNGYLFSEDLTLKTPTYVIQLDAPKTYWRYIILKQNSIRNGHEAYVSSDQTDISFGNMEPLELKGQTYLTFLSAKPLDMAEGEKARFRLVIKDPSTGREEMIVSSLPRPSPGVIPVVENEKTVTNIYVNI